MTLTTRSLTFSKRESMNNRSTWRKTVSPRTTSTRLDFKSLKPWRPRFRRDSNKKIRLGKRWKRGSLQSSRIDSEL